MQHKYRFELTSESPLKIYEHPEEGTKYTVGVDAATGVGADWTVFNVLSNRLPFTQVANYRTKNSVVTAAKDLVELGWYYNTALLVIETRFPGNAVQDAAILTYKYPNNYRQEEHLDADPSISDKFGICTTETLKWLLIRDLQDVLKNNELILNCPQTIDEILNFIYKEDKSKTGAVEGLNDDEVIALMLAVRGAKTYPQNPRPKTKPSLSADVSQQRSIMKKFMDDVRNPKQTIEAV